jgi:ferritin-like metal-binding protein YciE
VAVTNAPRFARNSALKDVDMKLFSANLTTLSALYTAELKKALDLEQTITKALPKMIEKATDTQVKQAFQSHLQETETHVQKVQSLLGDDASATCKVIHALVTEAEDTIKDITDPNVLDIALIGAAQQVEHHEIAVYGTLKAWAALLGKTEDVAILESIEADEKHADKLLSDISDRVNTEADTVAA